MTDPSRSPSYFTSAFAASALGYSSVLASSVLDIDAFPPSLATLDASGVTVTGSTSLTSGLVASIKELLAVPYEIKELLVSSG